MKEQSVRVVTIGSPTRGRTFAGAAILLVGALVLLGTTLAGSPGYRNLLWLGTVLLVAWLVDGTSRRYLGAGVASFAIGLGLTLGQDFGAPAAEHGIVYPLVGAGLVLVALVNATEARNTGLFLLIVGATVWSFGLGLSYNPGYEMALLLLVWGIVRVVTARRADVDRTPQPTALPADEPAGRR